MTTLEDTARTARRILGGENGLVLDFEFHLRMSRAALLAREALPGEVCEEAD